MNYRQCSCHIRVFSLILILALCGVFPSYSAGIPAQPASESASFIVQSSSAANAARLVEKYGGQVTSRLDLIHGVGAQLPSAALALLEHEPGVTALTANGEVSAAKKDKHPFPQTDYPDAVGADVAWGQGATGSGISVAVVDTGLDWVPGLFKDLNGKTSGRIIAWMDFVAGSRLPRDPNGHGTHVAGIIANTQIGADGEWNGVAPGINLVGVRVLNEEGYGTYEQVIQGIQWVVEHRQEYNIRVLNLSLVATAQSPYWADPLNQAVTQAWAEGITVVAAAGNDGPSPMTVGVPGNNPYVITVGAFTDNYSLEDWNDDTIAPFSAAGPTLDGFAKPDIVAPGAHMVSIVSPASGLAKDHQDNQLPPHYFSMAGTSQAAGVVSGVAALTLSQHPELTPDQVKYRLMATAFPWVDPTTTKAFYSLWQQGAGRVNAPDSVFGDLSGAANQGMDIWADLAGDQHYQGYSYYDEVSGKFKLHGDFETWDGGYWTWDGGYGLWSGGYGLWSGGYGLWSGGYGLWSGGYGLWSGGYGLWSGGYGLWSGGYGLWSGGYGLWSGGYGLWSGSEPWSDSAVANPAFVERFLSGKGPDASTTTTSINDWIDEP